MDDQDGEDDDGQPIAKIPYERQEMNMEEFNIDFDTENPPIDIPAQVVEPTDNDFDLPYQPPEMAVE